MSIKEKYQVLSIHSFQYKDWLLGKHYAKRMPNIMHSFGLFEENHLCGVITFGMTANNSLNEFIKGCQCLELNRLCVDENLPKNTLSFFVSQALQMLPQPMAVISYADTGQGHHGYIYQATNWIYTGLGKGDIEFIKNGRQFHRKNIFDMFGTGNVENAVANGFEAIKVLPKHRYIMLLANKKRRKEMLQNLPFKIESYPKGDNRRYNADYKPITQQLLFV